MIFSSLFTNQYFVEIVVQIGVFYPYISMILYIFIGMVTPYYASYDLNVYKHKNAEVG